MNIDTSGPLSVTAVLVTYGSRWHLLSKVLQELLNYDQVSAIVVVDNGSTYDLSCRLRVDALERVKLISLGQNLGSAGGYAAGIREAYDATSADLIWLLD